MNTLVGEHGRVKGVSELRFVSSAWHARSVGLELDWLHAVCVHTMVATILVTRIVVGTPRWFHAHLTWNCARGVLDGFFVRSKVVQCWWLFGVWDNVIVKILV